MTASGEEDGGREETGRTDIMPRRRRTCHRGLKGRKSRRISAKTTARRLNQTIEHPVIEAPLSPNLDPVRSAGPVAAVLAEFKLIAAPPSCGASRDTGEITSFSGEKLTKRQDSCRVRPE
jgi:hypothetical protein